MKALLETADGTADSAKRKEAYGEGAGEDRRAGVLVPLFRYARYYAYTSDLN